MLSIELTGKVALVVGGSRGIGAGIVDCLARAGAVVVFTHTGKPEHAGRLEEFVARRATDGGPVEPVAVAATDAAATTALVNRIVRERGRLDILVHNVGKNTERAVAVLTDDQWRETLDINLTSAFSGVRAALPHMVRQGSGRIILIGSSAVYSGGGGAIDYAAAKAGLTGLMTYLCKTHAQQGILTNIIHPCVIETDLLRERYPDEGSKQKLVAGIPAGRLGRPADIAGLVAYLASPWGDYVCGQEILVDGGRTVFG